MSIRPAYYGGVDNPYEAIKVIEAWGLNFSLGNAVKYISRAGMKSKKTQLEDLKKALTYLEFEIKRLEPKLEDFKKALTDLEFEVKGA